MTQLPLIKIKDFAPKVFDKDDQESSYNQKYKLKVQKNKVLFAHQASKNQVPDL